MVLTFSLRFQLETAFHTKTLLPEGKQNEKAKINPFLNAHLFEVAFSCFYFCCVRDRSRLRRKEESARDPWHRAEPVPRRGRYRGHAHDRMARMRQ